MDEDFMNIAEIRRRFRIGYKKARQIFDLAEKIDDSELKYRVFPNKVRKESVNRIITEKK